MGKQQQTDRATQSSGRDAGSPSTKKSQLKQQARGQDYDAATQALDPEARTGAGGPGPAGKPDRFHVCVKLEGNADFWSKCVQERIDEDLVNHAGELYGVFASEALILQKIQAQRRAQGLPGDVSQQPHHFTVQVIDEGDRIGVTFKSSQGWTSGWFAITKAELQAGTPQPKGESDGQVQRVYDQNPVLDRFTAQVSAQFRKLLELERG